MVMGGAHTQRRSISRWLEYATYFVLFTLLSNAFLGLWARLRAGDEAVGLASAEGDPVTRFLLLAAYLSAIFWGAASFHRVARLFLRAPLLVLLLLWALASIGWSEAPEVAFRRVVAVILGSVVAAFLVVRFDFKELLSLLGWVLLLSLGASFVVALVLPDIGRIPELRGESWAGVFIHKNSLGRFALLGVLVFAWLFSTRRRGRSVWGLAVLLSLLLLYESDSRSAQILLLALVLWLGMLGLARRLRRVWPAYLAAVVLIIGGVSASLVANMDTIVQLTGRDLTLTGRVPLWGIVLGYIQERPFLGYGFGSFWLEETYGIAVSGLAGWSVPHAHNGFLDLWLDLGAVGLGLGLLFLFASLYHWWRIYMRTGSSEALFWLTIWAFLLLYNFTESNLLRSNNLLWTLCMLTYLRSLRLGGVLQNKMVGGYGTFR
jgi:exopolysaccharide production protein ExoQ